MDIRCPQCETLYEFDESQLDSGSATLKCRKCQHMFRLGENSQPSREDTRRWMARAPGDGEILYFEGFDTLHEWIVEGKVDERWEISRTGDSWTRLADVGEFQPLFQAVDDAADVGGADAVSRSDAREPEQPADEGRDEKGTLDQFEGVDPGATPAGQPANASRDAGLDSDQSPPETIDETTGAADGSGSDISVPNDSVEGRNLEGPEPERDSRQRTRSPASQKTAPGAKQPEQSGGGLPPEPDTPARREAASSSGERAAARSGSDERDVQLESGQFGGTDEPSPTESDQVSNVEDEWAFEDESSEFGDTTDVVDEDFAYESGGSNWLAWTALVVAVIAGGVTLLWTFERERVRGWLDAVSGSSEPSESSPEEPTAKAASPAIEAANIEFAEALGRASGAASTKAESYVSTAHDEAAKAVGSAVEAARSDAESEAEGSSEAGGGGGGSVISLLSAAREARQNGATGRASRLYKKVLARDPQNTSALTGLGWTKLNQGQAGAARNQFAKAKRLNPSFGGAYIGLGRANRQLGNLQEALSNYRTYLDRFPSGSQASIARHQKKQLEKRLGVN